MCERKGHVKELWESQQVFYSQLSRPVPVVNRAIFLKNLVWEIQNQAWHGKESLFCIRESTTRIFNPFYGKFFMCADV
ncbi:hypothetical protein E2320_020907, partial [Naja naja]